VTARECRPRLTDAPPRVRALAQREAVPAGRADEGDHFGAIIGDQWRRLIVRGAVALVSVERSFVGSSPSLHDGRKQAGSRRPGLHLDRLVPPAVTALSSTSAVRR
jgi:hypothetical protein